MNTARILAGICALLAAGLLASCDDKTTADPAPQEDGTDAERSFVVASDLHYLSPALMTDTSTADFKAYMDADRKMLVQSPALLHSVLDSVRSELPDFVLLTGDLTKDGEKRSHQDLADSLATLRRLGVAVYVIPGNHDVHNPEAEAYGPSGAEETESVTASEFAAIYHDCGFDQAIARDTASLSYVVDIAPGLRLLALDPVRWRDNIGASKETVGGRFLPQTSAWIRAQLAQAKADGRTVVGAMHHGIVEHFEGQATNPVSADYVVAGHDSLREIFVEGGLRVVFTGHFHANDIAVASVGSSSLVDIETGSLVTAPSPFRRGRIADGTLTVSSSRVREIAQNVGGDFQTWARTWLLSGMTGLSAYTLRTQFGVDSASAASLAPVVASAYMAHYAGDEAMDNASSQTISLLRSQGTTGSLFLAGAMQSLLSDLAPADSAGSFPLR